MTTTTPLSTAPRTGRTRAALAAVVLACCTVLGAGPALATATSGADDPADTVDAGVLAECTTALHDSYTATGPDGEQYPTWHPTTVTDPDTGELCTFGHEHGDDPATSDIVDWAMDRRGGDADGLTFGFAAHMSTLGEGSAHRHEDHYGHKVFVLNDVSMVRDDRGGSVTDAAGEAVTCGHLIHVHQGTHSADALSNNQHEVLYATQCTDGTEIVLNALTGFGDANEYTASCDGRTVTTGGSELPEGTGGGREIPDATCVAENGDEFWGLYEIWKADHVLTTADGAELVRFDPWFGVRNPSRVADGAEAVATVGLREESFVTWPWSALPVGVEKDDPASPFTGDQRDVYVQHSTFDNAGGATAVYTDAYGQSGSTEPFEGAIAQYVGATSNTGWAEPERRAFGFSTDYGSRDANELGVHAPN